MKKKLILLGTIACTAIIYFAVGSNKTSNASLLIQYVEALADGEGGGSTTCKEPWTSVCDTVGNVVVKGTKQ